MDLLDVLNGYHNTLLPMHMPGHKRNEELAPYLAALTARLDVTEVDGLDDLHHPNGILRDGMAQTAALWGSHRAFWLVNGSTCGILAGIYAAVPTGGKVICARNCHKSVYNGLSLVQAEPVFLLPDTDHLAGISGPISPESVTAALDQNPDAKLVIITSPTYEGVLSDIAGICRISHARGVPLLVDEAHGSHLGFGYGFPDGAVHAGADIVIHSLHKTLPSLTQTAVLHFSGNLIDERCIENGLAVFETSSPSYLLMASISGCVELIKTRGKELFFAWQDHLKSFYSRTGDLHNLAVMACEWLRDPSKIVIFTGSAGMTGSELAEILRRKYRIETEMAAGNYIVAMTGMGDTAETLGAFADAVLDIDLHTSKADPEYIPAPVLPERTMTPAQAAYLPNTAVPLALSAGKISAEYVWAYPPGVPLIVPGEIISENLLSSIHRYTEMDVCLRSTQEQLPEVIFILK